MHYQKIIGGGIAICVGGFYVTRPFVEFYVSAYPIGRFLKQLVGINRIDAQEYLALLVLAAFYLVQILAGLLVISFGFDSLRGFRKPLIVATGIFMALIAAYYASIFL
jgi:uncharacterized membrane protein HdeD (DUF308 family)